MKNIHILPTKDKSRLHVTFVTSDNYDPQNKDLNIDNPKWILYDNPKGSGKSIFAKHVYITSDEEIKEEDWFLNPFTNEIQIDSNPDECKKIILTTNPELIEDGVQAIDDSFLQWLVKNPECEFVEIEDSVRYEDEWIDDSEGGEIYQHQYCSYKIILPKQLNEITEKGVIDVIGTCANCGVEFHIHKKETPESFIQDIATHLGKTVPETLKHIESFSKELDKLKEESKLETLEEAAKQYYEENIDMSNIPREHYEQEIQDLMIGFAYKWQQLNNKIKS